MGGAKGPKGIGVLVAPISWLSMVLIALLYVAYKIDESSPVPPLIYGLHDKGSGIWGACTPRDQPKEADDKIPELDDSPSFSRRLARSFPVDSSEKALIKLLTEQGFKMLSPCDGDSSIHRAYFKQGTKWLEPPMVAEVDWKVDETNKIRWIKGFIGYRE